MIACIDDGPGGLAAARVAESLASRLGSRVLLATVQPTAPRVPGRVVPDPATVGSGRRLIARVAQELDHPAELRVVFGEPAERLIALAQRESAELVAISAPTHEPTTARLLGSVYLALAGAGPCPVVVVPRDLDTQAAVAGPIVCGVDGSQPSLAAVRVAAELARLLDAPLRLVNVAVTPAGRAGPRAARRTLRDAADGLSTHTAVSLLVEHGAPAERLATVAARESARLIVTASRGRGSVASLLGSVSSRLAAQTTRPLVIVPSPARLRAAPERLALTGRRLRSGGILSVRGEIDIATAPELEREANRLLADAHGRLVLDLSGTTFMDVQGLRVTQRLSQRASELGGGLVLVAATPSVRRLLDLVPDPWITETVDLDTALEAIADRSPTSTEAA